MRFDVSKKILLIAPDFFDYKAKVVRALEKSGYNVTCVPEFKVSLLLRMSKLFTHHFYEKGINNHNDFLMDTISDDDYDFLFMIKGSFISIDFLSFFKKNNPLSKTIMYQWDSLCNYNYKHLVSSFDNVFSFDLEDAKQHSIKYLPLFFDSYEKPIVNYDDKDRNIDLLFVGSFHGDRHKICTILKNKYSHDYNLFFYLYISKFEYFKRLLFDFDYIPLSDVRFTPLDKGELQLLISRSKGILDIESCLQSGLTIRTFETLNSGVKLFTTNMSILTLGNISSNRFSVLNRNNPILLKSDFIICNNITDGINDYSIEHWLSNLGF